MSQPFGPKALLDCYRRGVFPMADGRDDPNLFLIDPDERGILPLDRFHIPRRLKRTVCRDPFTVTVDKAFTRVMDACAAPEPGRPTTWINAAILNLYSTLHRQGHAHSVECWDKDELVGGLYGVSLRGAFFGESMFSRRTDASKIALVHLVARLKRNGYRLLDAQFHNPHLEQFGLEEVSRTAFQALLQDALALEADFYGSVPSPSGARGAGALSSSSSESSVMSGKEAVHWITQTS